MRKSKHVEWRLGGDIRKHICETLNHPVDASFEVSAANVSAPCVCRMFVWERPRGVLERLYHGPGAFIGGYEGA